MFFIFFKKQHLLKNNCFLILVNRACSLPSCLSSSDGQQPPEVGWCLSAEDLEDDEEGPVNSGPPGPLRGISSSLQGVWQACSPINCSCSPHPHVYKAPPAHIPGTGSTGTAAPAPSSTGGRGRWTREDILLKSLKMLDLVEKWNVI